VQKKDGTWRFCVNYRKLNDITIKNRFPMPLMDEILDELAGTRYFAKLDMTAGYHQVRMKQEDEHKTAFKNTPWPLSIQSDALWAHQCPCYFSVLDERCAQPIFKEVCVLLDDILIYSPDLPSHIGHLSQVLEQLRKHQLYMKKHKCSFAKQQLSYLGHIISDKSVPLILRRLQQWSAGLFHKMSRS